MGANTRNSYGQNEDQIKQVTTNINKVATSAPYNLTTAQGHWARLGGEADLSGTAIAVIMAAIDLFLEMNPKHYHAKLKIGTIATKNRGAAALLGYMQVSDHVQLSAATFARCMMVPSLRASYIQIGQDGQEVDHPYSLAKYLMDFGYSKVSPYGVSQHYDLFMFCAIVGILTHNSRFYGTRKSGEGPSPSILKNAVCVGLNMRDPTEFSKQFHRSTTASQEYKKQQEAKESLSLTGRPGTKITNYIEDKVLRDCLSNDEEWAELKGRAHSILSKIQHQKRPDSLITHLISNLAN